jgi:DNA-binding NarL/FixJ family response regulator
VIKLIVADDHALARGGLRAMLGAEDDLEVVGEAADGAEAVDLALKLRPDVVVMDIRMPRLDGIEATRRLAAARSRARVLVVTTLDHDEYVVQALKAGAAGFVLKDSPPDRLAAAVRAVAEGDSLLAPTTTRRLIETRLQRSGTQEPLRARFDELTDRERDIVRALARGLAARQARAALARAGGRARQRERLRGAGRPRPLARQPAAARRTLGGVGRKAMRMPAATTWMARSPTVALIVMPPMIGPSRESSIATTAAAIQMSSPRGVP